MPASAPLLSLAFGLSFADLYDPEGLARIDREFQSWIGQADEALAARLRSARADPALAYKDEAELLIAAAPHLDRFVARLFATEDEWQELVEGHQRLAPLFRVKRQFVQRRRMLKIKPDLAA